MAAGALVLALAAALPRLGRTTQTSAAATAEARRPPNFLLIESDDQAQNSFKRKFMPQTFRHIVDRGTSFPNGLAAPPLCCPERAGILTGQYPHNHGVFTNNPGYANLRDPGDTLPVWLRRAGYRTGLVGKFLNHYSDVGGADPAPGFDRWFSYVSDPGYYGYEISDDGEPRRFGDERGQYSTDVFTRQAERFLSDSAGSRRPFFLWLAYNAPHGGPSSSVPQCSNRSAPTPPGPAAYDAVRGISLPRPPSFNEKDVSDKPLAIRSLPPLDHRATTQIKKNWHCTLAAVAALDKGIGEVFSSLRRDGELQHTIIVYLSDNGFFFGEHRRKDGKSDVYEPALDVPFAVRVPRPYRSSPPVPTRNAVVSNQDIAPTLLAYARSYLGPIPSCAAPGDCRRIDGRSLRRLLGGPGQWRAGRGVLVEIDDGAQDYHAIRTRRYVYSELATGERELYDLRRDPFELTNRADMPAYTQLQAALAHRLALLERCSGSGGRDGPTARPFCE